MNHECHCSWSFQLAILYNFFLKWNDNIRKKIEKNWEKCWFFEFTQKDKFLCSICNWKLFFNLIHILKFFFHFSVHSGALTTSFRGLLRLRKKSEIDKKWNVRVIRMNVSSFAIRSFSCRWRFKQIESASQTSKKREWLKKEKREN